MTSNKPFRVLAALAVVLLILSLGAVQALGQSYSSYNTLFSGFTVTQSTNSLGQPTFGFSSNSNQVIINGTSYTLNDVSSFALLYSTAPSSMPAQITTSYTGNPNADSSTWQSFVFPDKVGKSQVFGWTSPNSGTLQPGDIMPLNNSFSTGQVFSFASSPLPPGYNYGFDISLKGNYNDPSPFGGIFDISGNSTGRVTLDPVPESPYLQLAVLLACAGLMGLWRIRLARVVACVSA